MLNVFLQVILPIFIVAAIAGVFQHYRRLPVSAFSQVTLYLFSPCLIFISLVDQKVPAGTSLRLVAATLLSTLFILVVALVVSRVLRHDRPMRSAFLLATGFPNSGNMALPILLLAFGQAGLTVGVIVFITQAILGNSLGIFVAARSQSGGFASIGQVFKLPTVYAIIAALIAKASGVTLPPTLYEPLRLLSQAAIPVMLVVLGLQLERGVKVDDVPSLVSAVVLRLLVAAPLAFVAGRILGLSGLGIQTLIIISAMPVAVFTTILATQFEARPKFVTTAVIVTTSLALFTLTGVVTVVKNYLA